MITALKRHAQTIAVAMVTAAVTAGAPAIAGSFAENADKVDGFHAVKASSTAEERAGKLVATSPRTGRLPGSIIKKAPDSNTLDGKDSGEFALDGEVLDLILGSDGAGSGLDADSLDGFSSAAFAQTNDVFDIVLANDGDDSGLNADTLNGLEPWHISPKLEAETDRAEGGTVLKDESFYFVNNMSQFYAPTSGTLTISGSVFINNDETNYPGLLYSLVPTINLQEVQTGNSGSASFQPGPSGGSPGNTAERFTLSYTVTVPVSPGMYSIAQKIEAQDISTGGTPAVDFFFNRANLTALFTPAGAVETYVQPPSES